MAQATDPSLRNADDGDKVLSGVKVAILCTEGVEQVELFEPRRALLEAGAHVDVVSPESEKFQGYNHRDKGEMIEVDVNLAHALPEDYDALVLPGGVINPDQLRADEDAIAFIRSFVSSNKPIAAICHGPWTLIDAGGVAGKRMTSWRTLKSDLKNAGALWEDTSVVNDQGLVTSRKPDDLPDFNREMIHLFASAKAVGTDAHSSGLQPKKNQDSVAPSAQI